MWPPVEIVPHSIPYIATKEGLLTMYAVASFKPLAYLAESSPDLHCDCDRRFPCNRNTLPNSHQNNNRSDCSRHCRYCLHHHQNNLSEHAGFEIIRVRRNRHRSRVRNRHWCTKIIWITPWAVHFENSKIIRESRQQSCYRGGSTCSLIYNVFSGSSRCT